MTLSAYDSSVLTKRLQKTKRAPDKSNGFERILMFLLIIGVMYNTQCLQAGFLLIV